MFLADFTVNNDFVTVLWCATVLFCYETCERLASELDSSLDAAYS